MKTIYKYNIPNLRCGYWEWNVDMPESPTILKVQCIDGDIFLWATVDTEKKTVPVKFVVAGTGFCLPDGKALTYLDTVFERPLGYEADLVWHIFCEQDTLRSLFNETYGISIAT